MLITIGAPKPKSPRENIDAFKKRFMITPDQITDLYDKSKFREYILEDWVWNGAEFGRKKFGEFIAILLKHYVISSEGSLLEIVTQAYDFFKLNLSAKVARGFRSKDSLRKAIEDGNNLIRYTEIPKHYKFIIDNSKNRIPNSSKRNKVR